MTRHEVTGKKHMEPNFIHLRTHSEYSLVDGILRIKPFVNAVADAQMPAVALTDQCNLFAAVKFYRAAINAGIKPILGTDLLLHNDQDPKHPYRFTLLCQNEIGYRSLTRLVSKAYIEGQVNDIAMVQATWLTPDSVAGLIALSGGREGDIGQALLHDNHQQAQQLLQHWSALFPQRFYLELQRTGRDNEENYISAALNLAHQQHIPVVATNDVRFLQTEDFEAHEARVCIHDGFLLNDKRRIKRYSKQQYLRTPEEMARLFADIPEALTNSVEIAKRCNLTLNLEQVCLPNFPVPNNLTIEQFLAEKSQQGLEERLQIIFTDPDERQSKRQIYDERLQTELKVINSMGYPGYFLIVADFIQWAKAQQIPVGPGRGSGAGSLVAYALKITDLDPLEYDLLFERFLNPERVSMPDFDIDFCMEKRDQVIEYVAEKYGRDSVSQIITYGSMAARAVVRDVGRVLGQPYGFVDKIAKLIPFELGITLDKALEQDELLKERYKKEEEVKTLLDLARKLEGITRNAGKHAGGVVIAPSALTDFAPLYCEQDSDNIVTQFDKDDVEAVGLVKFDFLGLRTLTIIDWAVQTINATRANNNETPLDISQIPLDDPQTFTLLKACATTAVFQLESRGIKDLIKRLQPDCFEDIIALVALFRPGPLQSGMVDDFINRKHGRAQVEHLHPSLEHILHPTYGIILYQEQVMQIAQVLSGYSLGGADLLRRAMGKKKTEEMAKQRHTFISGAKERGVEEPVANYIFDLVEKFAGYGFNKSHSAAYALLAYQTAWLKTHYPQAFMAAVLSSDMDNTDKVVNFIDDCKQLKLDVLPPDVNVGEYSFTVDEQKRIIYGLGAIKGAGEAALESIIAARKQTGKFTDLFDFCQRVDLRKVNRRVIEALIRSGAMDNFGSHRAALMQSLEQAIKAAEQHLQNQLCGQNDMFGEQQTTKPNEAQQLITCPAWSDAERLAGEKSTLGIYLTGHPIDRYTDELSYFTTAKFAELNPRDSQTVTIAGLVIGIRTMMTKRGKRMAFVTLDDQTRRIELAVFSETYEKCREILVKDTLLVAEGEISYDDYSGGHRISANNIYTIEQARSIYAKYLRLELTPTDTNQTLLNTIKTALQPFRGGNCPVQIHYQHPDAKANLKLDNAWNIIPNDNVLTELKQTLGEDKVTFVY